MAALHIIFNYTQADFKQIDELQESLERVVSFRKVGKYDGYELDKTNSTGAYFLSSGNSESLFRLINPVLKEYTFLKGGHVKLQVAEASNGGVKTVSL